MPEENLPPHPPSNTGEDMGSAKDQTSFDQPNLGPSERSLSEKLKSDEEIPEIDKQRILKDIESGMALWHRMAIKLNLTLIVLSSIAVFSSLYVTAFTGSCAINTLGIRVLSFLSALCLTAITAFNVNGKGRGVRKGWRHLKNALLRYKARNISLEELIQASHEAEEMLGYVDYQSDNVKKTSSSGS